METIGWLFILGGTVLIRSVAVGRAPEIPSDLRDIFTGVLTGDSAKVKATLALRGSGLTGVSVVSATSNAVSATRTAVEASGKNSALLSEVIRLGSASSGLYVWGSSGPKTYDCSGLVWRAMRNLKLYDGARFTTRTFPNAIAGTMAQVPNGSIGDVVLWPTHHMGVMADGGRIYGALSIKTGIGYASIANITAATRVQPQYWTLMSKSSLGVGGSHAA